MPSDSHSPRLYPGVMISSTFTDLKDHRAALIKAVEGQEFKGVVMENDSAKADVDVIDSSLQMARDASAYIGLISHKYGQTPVSPDRNPEKLSITELEFNEAQRLGRPILLFIMGDNHPVRPGDVETNQAKRRKLKAFRERARKMGPDSQVHRVYATFDSLEEFKEKAIHAVAGLRRHPTKIPQRTLGQSTRAGAGAGSALDVMFGLVTPDKLRKVQFGLTKTIQGTDVLWTITFELLERASASTDFGTDPDISLIVNVDPALNDKAGQVARHGLTAKQAAHATGPAAKAVKAAVTGEIPQWVAEREVQSTIQ
jgi:hypothetical protein